MYTLRQWLFIFGLALIVLGLMTLTFLMLVNSQSPDPVQMQDAARQCLDQLTGNCALTQP